MGGTQDTEPYSSSGIIRKVVAIFQPTPSKLCIELLVFVDPPRIEYTVMLTDGIFTGHGGQEKQETGDGPVSRKPTGEGC